MIDYRHPDSEMITLYTRPSCTSCRKAKAWLDYHNLPYTEINVSKFKPSTADLFKILALSEDGVFNLISRRGRAFRALNIDISDMHLDQLVVFLSEHSNVLKLPIIFDNRRLQIGFNEDNVRQFIPRHIRNQQIQSFINSSD